MSNTAVHQTYEEAKAARSKRYAEEIRTKQVVNLGVEIGKVAIETFSGSRSKSVMIPILEGKGAFLKKLSENRLSFALGMGASVILDFVFQALFSPQSTLEQDVKEVLKN